MNKRSIPWFLIGLTSAIIGLISFAGCGSARGDCEDSCNRACDVTESCEDYVPGDFDVAQCHKDCAESCDDLIDAKEKECDNGISVDGEAVGDCNESLSELQNACADQNDGQVLSNFNEVSGNCTQTKFYRCN